MAIVRIAVTGTQPRAASPWETVNLSGAGLAAVTSGDIVQGDDTTGSAQFCGVALSDYVDASTEIPFLVHGVLDLPVTAKLTAGSNSAVVVGDFLYINSSDGRLDKGPGTVVFGRALEAISSGSDDTIRVLVGQNIAQTVTEDTIIMPFTIPIPPLANLALNELILDGFTFGFAGTIERVGAVGLVDATTAADVELTMTIAGTVTTGGVIAMTEANINEGDYLAGTAITAANSFTSAQEINLKVTEATTPFTEGEAYVIAMIGFPHDHV